MEEDDKFGLNDCENSMWKLSLNRRPVTDHNCSDNVSLQGQHQRKETLSLGSVPLAPLTIDVDFPYSTQAQANSGEDFEPRNRWIPQDAQHQERLDSHSAVLIDIDSPKESLPSVKFDGVSEFLRTGGFQPQGEFAPPIPRRRPTSLSLLEPGHTQRSLGAIPKVPQPTHSATAPNALCAPTHSVPRRTNVLSKSDTSRIDSRSAPANPFDEAMQRDEPEIKDSIPCSLANASANQESSDSLDKTNDEIEALMRDPRAKPYCVFDPDRGCYIFNVNIIDRTKDYVDTAEDKVKNEDFYLGDYDDDTFPFKPIHSSSESMSDIETPDSDDFIKAEPDDPPEIIRQIEARDRLLAAYRGKIRQVKETNEEIIMLKRPYVEGSNEKLRAEISELQANIQEVFDELEKYAPNIQKDQARRLYEMKPFIDQNNTHAAAAAAAASETTSVAFTSVPQREEPNSLHKISKMRSTPSLPEIDQLVIDDSLDKWSCQACTFRNHIDLHFCECCECPRRLM